MCGNPHRLKPAGDNSQEQRTVRHTAANEIVGAQPTGPQLSETTRLTAEVEDLKHIHGLSLRLAEANTLQDVLLEVLRTAAQLVDARLGSVQLLMPDGKLGMIGQIGFGDDVVDQFGIVGLEDCSTCAVALRRRARVSVPDLRTDSDFSEIAAALRAYGAVGAVSTPVLDKAGNVLAMLSVYWLEEHQPDDRELTALDLCAELAGRHVERGVHDQRQSLLMRELAHRGKNLLSVVQAIATRSLRGERTLDEARDVFVGRLGALANTYNTLTEQSPESVQLHDIVTASLSSHGQRAGFAGPAIAVPAKNAQTLALVIHELATNAAKYGALSVASGRIKVAWEITRTSSDDARFSLTWSETGGPPIAPPARQGFGFLIITSVIGSELQCVPTMDYPEHGFQYHLDCRLSALTERGL
jgi:two-component sensor histidine kinase